MALLFLAPPALTCAWDNASAWQLFGFFWFRLKGLLVFAILNLNLANVQAYSGMQGGGRTRSHHGD